MRSRSERQQDFESIKQNLFTAGVATVKAAQAQENMFMTTLEALSEAYEGTDEGADEGTGANQLDAGQTEPKADLTSIVEMLLAQRQNALSSQDYDAYVEAEEKLQLLDELALARLERQVRMLKAQQDLAKFAGKPQPQSDTAAWTEAALRKEYKTLANLRSAFNIKTRTWKDAVAQINSSI
ncbi:MAG: hypothetical protein ACFCVB_18055 [Nodosilinea sp.]